MKFFEREMAMPKWKYRMFKTIDLLKTKEFWKALFEGIFIVTGTLLLIATFWMAMWLFGEDELKTHGKHFNYKIKQNTTYKKAD